MAQFVNYKKRAFTLPPGCKDLIDVLTPSRRLGKAQIVSSSFPPLEIKEERFQTAGLAQIGRFVTMVLQSHGETFTLSVNSNDFEFPVMLYRTRNEQTAAIVLVTEEAHTEQAIRAFFESRGIGILWDYAPSESDKARGLVYPLPSEAPRASTLTTELLRSVYALSDEAGIDFRYYEVETAA